MAESVEVKLIMNYQRQSGRWLIQTTAGKDGPPVQFPSENRVAELWSEHASGKGGILVGSSIVGRVRGFYVKIERKSTLAQRRKFLDALSAETVVTAVDVRCACVCTYNNELGDHIARALAAGFELLVPPVFSHLGEPAGWNGAAVGYKHPHFLITIIKRS